VYRARRRGSLYRLGGGRVGRATITPEGKTGARRLILDGLDIVYALIHNRCIGSRDALSGLLDLRGSLYVYRQNRFYSPIV
jgi:hypothetical protein